MKALLKCNYRVAITACALGLSLCGLRAQSVYLDSLAGNCASGTSTAGVYTLTGSIQPSAARVHSSDFTIDTGSWSFVAVIQDPGAPVLSVRMTQTNTFLASWPMASTGFELAASSEITSANWPKVNVPSCVVVMGENRIEKHVVLPTPVGKKFYRLQKSQ